MQRRAERGRKRGVGGDTSVTGALPRAWQERSVAEGHPAGKVEAAHQDMGRIVGGAGRRDAKAMRHDPVRAQAPAKLAHDAAVHTIVSARVGAGR